MPKKIMTRELLDREIALYLQDKGAGEPYFQLYRDLFLLQQCYSSEIKSDCSRGRDHLRKLLLGGRYLLSDIRARIAPALFKKILGEVIEVFVGIFPMAEPLRRIMELPQLADSRLPEFLGRDRLFDCDVLEKIIRSWGWEEKEAADVSLVAGTVHDSLAPFYISFARAAQDQVDLALWSEGCCPVCGQGPGMAMLDQEGARILECSFCYTEWQFPRLECPFCRNKDPQQLGYFYTDGYPGRRVQVCERCRSYLKTAVVKELGREVILGLEEVYTLDLDALARHEGYRAGRDLALLQ